MSEGRGREPIRSHEERDAGQASTDARIDERWRLLVPYRGDLLRFARVNGAGSDAEDVAHEAILAAALYDDLDIHRPWGLLASIAARRIADRYRHASRDRSLVHHRGLVPRSRSFDQDVVDRAEAKWMADLLGDRLPRAIMDILWSHYVDGATWAELAARHGISADTLKQRACRALMEVRRNISRGRS
jgi:DNA-directed RNA polymerase specialized sigma24 family protein